MKSVQHHIDEGDVFASFMHSEEWYRHGNDIPRHLDEGDVFASFMHDDERTRH